jgi:hypothetical protein
MALRAMLPVLVALSVAGCAASGGDEDGACALQVTYKGHAYQGVSVRVAPVEGEFIGQAILPACSDTGDEPEDSAQQIDLVTIPGVSPDVALGWQGHPDTVLVREGVDRSQQPDELTALFRAPRCDRADEPISLEGPWDGILGADGHTELDLVPPYDVYLYAARSSPRGYERAYLTVRVPAELGKPITRYDLKSSLWRGGRISIVARCVQRRFVATEVAAYPPN